MIDVWLKIKDRGNLYQVLRHLNFWLAIFSDNNHKIYIYNENVELPNFYYQNYTVINRAITLENSECAALQTKVNSLNITEYWKPAAYALAAQYYYLNNSEYSWNIDADDITIFGFAKKYINVVEDRLKTTGLPTLSWDLHLSKHIGDNGKFRPHHWTFGVNFSKTQEMKNIISNALNEEMPPAAPWGVNLDYIVDVYLQNKTDYRFISFIAPAELVHTFGPNGRHVFFSKYLDGKVEVSFDGRGELSKKHDKSMIIS